MDDAVMLRFLIPSWEEIHESVLRLVNEILVNGYRIDLIVGILRGGYIVARILCDLLKANDIGVVEVKFYRGVEERAERPIITQPLTADVRGKNILIVDDVVDSGRTLEIVTEQVRLRGAKNVKSAVLYYKPRSIIKPDYFVHETVEWIVFPWEWGEFIRDIMARERIDDREKLFQRLKELNFPLPDSFLRELIIHVSRTQGSLNQAPKTL